MRTEHPHEAPRPQAATAAEPGVSLRALAFAATKTWDAVWDTLVADYLRLHRPALR